MVTGDSVDDSVIIGVVVFSPTVQALENIPSKPRHITAKTRLYSEMRDKLRLIINPDDWR